MDEDLSASNLAILCMPLVMSIPPISVYDVPDSAVLWYVLATDVLAVVPLLIKSIELIVLDKMNKESDWFRSDNLVERITVRYI